MGRAASSRHIHPEQPVGLVVAGSHGFFECVLWVDVEFPDMRPEQDQCADYYREQ